MIYIQIQTQEQMLMIPRSALPETPALPIRLTLKRGGAKVVFGGLEDLGVNTLYYAVTIPDTSHLATGEYDYILEDAEEKSLSIGILTAGEYVRKVKAVPGGNKIVEYGG